MVFAKERQVVTSQREGQRAKPTQPIEVAHGLKRKLLQAGQRDEHSKFLLV